MWQKFVAGTFVMTGALGFGWALCIEMNNEIQHLKAQKQILLYMIGEISYLHRPVEEIMDIIAEKIEAPYNNFLMTVSQKLQERSGKELINLWQESIDDTFRRTDISKAALGYFERMGNCFGCEGDKLQVEALKLFESELDAGINKALTKKEENSRLIRALSTLTGILCIVLFL